MKQSVMGIGLAMALGLVAPALRAEHTNGPVRAETAGHAAAVSDSWILLAGCPEACLGSAPSAASPLRSASAALDGNAWVMELNLAEDGLEGTQELAPSFDPGPGQDLVWALNRANDGLHERLGPTAPPAAYATASPPSSREAATVVRDAGLVGVAWSAGQDLTAWAWESYEGAIVHFQSHWRRTTQALGIALIRSWVAMSTATPDGRAVDPELQPPLDPLTTAWIQSVRLAETTQPDVRDEAATSLAHVNRTAIERPAINVAAGVRVGGATTAIVHDETEFSEPLRLASDKSHGPLQHSPPEFETAPPAAGEIGCGAVGLPRPIDAPERARRIAY